MENILSKAVLATVKQNAKNEVIANDASNNAMIDQAKILMGLAPKSKTKSAKELAEWKDLAKSICDNLPELKAEIKEGNMEGCLESKEYKDWRITLYLYGNTYYTKDMIEVKASKESFKLEQDKWETFDMAHLYKQDYKALALVPNKAGVNKNPMDLRGPSWKKICQPHKEKFANAVDTAYSRQMTKIAREFGNEFGILVDQPSEIEKATKKTIAYTKAMRNLELDAGQSKQLVAWLDAYPLPLK